MIEIMQKRIEEIKQADRKAYYELANEIGISEYSLYSFMTRDECSANTENKINSYLRGYLTKDEKLESYRMDNEELKAENERLKEEIRTEKIYSSQVEELEESLNHLKQENDRLKQTLQEIKEICKNSHTSASEDYYRTADKILDLINKSEVE